MKQPGVKSAVKMGQLLEFSVAFPGEQPLAVEDYLAGGSKDIILNIAAMFLGFRSQGSKFEDNAEFLSMFFSAENNAFANALYARIKTIENTGVHITISNHFVSLKVFEQFFKLPAVEVTQTKAAFERNFFKAYLLLNEKLTKAQEVAFSSTDHLDIDKKIPLTLFCMHYPLADKVSFDIKLIWATQMIKAVYLFEFLESYNHTKPILQAFLAHFGSASWQEYLKGLVPLTTPAIQNNNEAHTDIVISPGENFSKSCAFIEKLMITENQDLDQNDFLTVRAKPFYKVDEGVYRIIFNLFVVEKIFKGIYFLFRDVNDRLPANQRVAGLKSIFSYEFSEKVLLYKIIDIIYPEKWVRFSGKQLDDLGMKGAPDYYLRKGKDILLFESKDFLIAADKKLSFDLEVYDEEFGKRLYYETLTDGREKAGAVMQIIGNIRRILKKQFAPDTDYHYKEVFIFPILITHDHQYDTPGFNDMINFWFQEELAILREEGYFTHRVKPLVVLNIDALVYNQIPLRDSVPLHEVLRLYEEHIKIYENLRFPSVDALKEHHMSKMVPFAVFIDHLFSKRGIWEPPPVLEVVAPSLFKEEFN